MRASAISLLMWCAFACGGASAIEPFHAPAVPQGEIEVRLHPTEAVATGAPKLVTFAVPFPRGSLTAAALATVRVLRNDVEIPAHVEALTPWRHRSNASIDGASVRVAMVQITHTFAAPFPASEAIRVAWGGANRALDVPAPIDPRTAWHQVTSGSFLAADNVFEPDVYAVLPRAWLVRGALTGVRSTPFDPSNLDARDSPATNDAIAHWPDFQEAERAYKNEFYTVINQDPGSASAPNRYRTTTEPWLYDRASTMFRLYFRSGSFLALREAVRNAQFYAGRQNANGFFAFGSVGSDAKYAYNECLAYTYWTVADTTMPTRVARTPTAQSGFDHAWDNSGFWTERHAAFKLLANVVAYEVLGGDARRAAIEQILSDYRTHQDGANGLVPSPRVDGALYHTGDQHDSDEFPDNGSAFIASSWMTALISDAAVRAYSTGEDAATAQFVARMGDFLRSTIELRDDHGYSGATLASPRYAIEHDGSDGNTSDSDVEHALDVAGQLAWARYFRELSGGNGEALRDAALDLYATYDAAVNYWIEPGNPPGEPAYPVSPPRKWGWQHRTSDGLAFALTEVDANAVFTDGFESP
jgi:hypothetical protein